MIPNIQTAMVYSEIPSSWKSARLISRNLLSSYQNVIGDSCQKFNLCVHTIEDTYKLATAIHNFKPQRLIFPDDVVTPHKLILALEQLYEDSPLPEFYFHLYGSFTVRTNEWMSAEGALKKSSVRFICASERQARLVRSFLEKGYHNTVVCPFPVDEDEFFYSEKLRSSVRDQLKIRSDEQVILYTGRLSLQKNILTLVREFDQILKESKIPLRLLLVGPFEDRGAPFFKSTPSKLGTYYRQWLDLLAQLPSSTRSQIQYLGNQSSKVLNDLYNAADLFVSLSLYHDEDFGMSPAEALCAGLPSVLTNWGGFSGFQFNDPFSEYCKLVDVKLGNNGLKIDTDQFRQHVHGYLSIPRGNSFRIELSEHARKFVSVEKVSQILSQIHEGRPPKFEGFSELMIRQAEAYRKITPFPNGPKKGSLYWEIYKSYLCNA